MSHHCMLIYNVYLSMQRDDGYVNTLQSYIIAYRVRVNKPDFHRINCEPRSS